MKELFIFVGALVIICVVIVGLQSMGPRQPSCGIDVTQQIIKDACQHNVECFSILEYYAK